MRVLFVPYLCPFWGLFFLKKFGAKIRKKFQICKFLVTKMEEKFNLNGFYLHICKKSSTFVPDYETDWDIPIFIMRVCGVGNAVQRACGG